MLARGKGFINFEDLKKLFDLPEDAEIVSVDMGIDGVEFNIVSRDAIEGKTYITPYPHSVRRFRANLAPQVTTVNQVINVESGANPQDIAQKLVNKVLKDSMKRGK